MNKKSSLHYKVSSTFEKYKDSEAENRQLQTTHESYPSLIKQSLNFSFYDPLLFKHTSKFIELFLPPETTMYVVTELKYQNGDLVLKNVYKWIIEKSPPVTKTSVNTGSPFLL